MYQNVTSNLIGPFLNIQTNDCFANNSYCFFVLALALHFLHSKKISHFDLKPQNLLLSSKVNPVLKLAGEWSEYQPVYDPSLNLVENQGHCYRDLAWKFQWVSCFTLRLEIKWEQLWRDVHILESAGQLWKERDEGQLWSETGLILKGDMVNFRRRPMSFEDGRVKFGG